MQKNSYRSGIPLAVLLLTSVCFVATAQLPTTSNPTALHGKKQTQISAFAGPLQTERSFNRLIIKYKEQASTRAGVFDARAAQDHVGTLSASNKAVNPNAAGLSYLKSVTAQTHVAVTAQMHSRAELFALTKQLEQDPAVAYAEIDELAYPQFTPNDPSYAGQQWHYQAPGSFTGGANLPLAWDSATGSGMVVAVIDTGYRAHADLAANVLPGYDFISDLTTANDGDGRDSDASDPGDWTLANQCSSGSTPTNSTWHGTHVAGTIAAVTNNGIGVAGVAFHAKILPVRVLGVCGGYASDIAAGMQWAAGLDVPGVPANPNKAKVLNLSLGGSGACGTTYQDAVNAVRAAGSVVVVATGNNYSKTTISSPANCTGVMAVTAHTKSGDNAGYAQIGAGTTLSAPGGGQGVIDTAQAAPIDVYSTLNAGTTTPGADSYAEYSGTSMATPHVAGVAALLASLQPALTPDAMQSVLTSSARSHPAATYCAGRTDCGAGLLDAKAAIDRLNSLAPTASASVTAGVKLTGSTVTLTGQATAATGGNSVFSYQWTQVAGPAVTLSGGTASTASFVAPSPGNTYAFRLNVTDGSGLTASSSQVSVTTNTPPVLNTISSQSVVPGQNLSFTVTASDAESNPIVYVASGLPAGASLDAATGAFTWNNAGPAGNYSVTITPNDGIVNGNPQTVSISVASPSAGGGGGALSPWDLMGLLSLLTFGLAAARRRSAPK